MQRGALNTESKLAGDSIAIIEIQQRTILHRLRVEIPSRAVQDTSRDAQRRETHDDCCANSLPWKESRPMEHCVLGSRRCSRASSAVRANDRYSRRTSASIRPLRHARKHPKPATASHPACRAAMQAVIAAASRCVAETGRTDRHRFPAQDRIRADAPVSVGSADSRKRLSACFGRGANTDDSSAGVAPNPESRAIESPNTGLAFQPACPTKPRVAPAIWDIETCGE